MGQLTVSPPSPTLCLGGQPTVLNFEKGEPEKKMSAQGILKSLYHRYLPEGAYHFSCQKRLYKMKYMVLRAQFSNVSLGLL